MRIHSDEVKAALAEIHSDRSTNRASAERTVSVVHHSLFLSGAADR
jgi:hypothetical protein